MSIQASILFFVCCAVVLLPGHCYQQPSLELNIVIKATNTSINETFFEDELKPFLINLTGYLVFPEEVNDEYPEFARVAINIGSEQKTWSINEFQNLTRANVSQIIVELTPPYSINSDGTNNEALNQAYQTYSSILNPSAVLNRVTILMTDIVDPSEADLEVAQKLRAISEYFFIIGIPSVENPTFKDSMEAAHNLTQFQVYPTIIDASNLKVGVPVFLNYRMRNPTRPCRGVIFAYEASNYVDLALQNNYIKFVKSMGPAFALTDAISLVSFEELVNYNVPFLTSSKISQWPTKTSNTFDANVYFKIDNVYSTLQYVYKKTTLPYVSIVLLTQGDHYEDSDQLTWLMGLLGSYQNVDIFVYNAGNSIPNDFLYLTKNRRQRIFDIRNASSSVMSAIFADVVHPVIFNHLCEDGYPLTSTVPSTVPVSVSTSTHRTSTSTSSSKGYVTSVPLILGLLGLLKSTVN